MAITLDSSASANTAGATSLSWTHTCAGSNGILVVKILLYAYGTSVTGVTYGGVPLTLVPMGTQNFGGINFEAFVYALAGPALGSETVEITTSAWCPMLAISESWNGSNGVIRGNAVTDAEYTGSGSTAPSGSYQLSVVAGDLVTTFFANDSATVPTPTGAFGFLVSPLAYENAGGRGIAAFYAVSPVTSADVTYGYTGIAGTGYICIAFVIEAGVQFTSTRACPPNLLTSPTQCWAVLIERADGLKFGLTDATVPFVYDGVTYQVAQGADASNIHQETGTESPDMEISTVVNDALDYVTSTDVRGTRYNNSYWTVFIIDYMNPGNGIMILGVCRCSRATITDTGQKFQLKPLMSILEMPTGRTYCASCDVLSTFDKRCDPTGTLLAANSFSRTVGAIQAITSYNMCCDFFADTNPEFFYNFGNCTWTSGENDGLLSICKVHTVIEPAAWSNITSYHQGDYSTYGGHTYTSLISGNLNNEPDTSPADWLEVTGNPAQIARIIWRTPPPYPMAVGDVCTLVRGCDKIKTTCKSIPNAENPSGTNVENFHGYYLPSPDVALLVGKSNVQ